MCNKRWNLQAEHLINIFFVRFLSWDDKLKSSNYEFYVVYKFLWLIYGDVPLMHSKHTAYGNENRWQKWQKQRH